MNKQYRKKLRELLCKCLGKLPGSTDRENRILPSNATASTNKKVFQHNEHDFFMFIITSICVYSSIGSFYCIERSGAITWWWQFRTKGRVVLFLWLMRTVWFILFGKKGCLSDVMPIKWQLPVLATKEYSSVTNYYLLRLILFSCFSNIFFKPITILILSYYYSITCILYCYTCIFIVIMIILWCGIPHCWPLL